MLSEQDIKLMADGNLSIGGSQKELSTMLLQARAEIERLEKEVERLTTEREWAYYAAENSLAQRNTAWNDAIEAAAECAWADDAQYIARTIRALKRRQP